MNLPTISNIILTRFPLADSADKRIAPKLVPHLHVQVQVHVCTEHSLFYNSSKKTIGKSMTFKPDH